MFGAIKYLFLLVPLREIRIPRLLVLHHIHAFLVLILINLFIVVFEDQRMRILPYEILRSVINLGIVNLKH